jgi:hypothetical protein
MKQVIDTNVLLVANGKHDDASPDCTAECIRLLKQAQQHITVIDDGFRIISEYLHKTHPNQPKGSGDAFQKWLLQNRCNSSYVDTVKITEKHTDMFEEFHDQELQDLFDAPDRKFIAVASAHPDSPRILQATDCKWLDWWQRLADLHVHIKFVCPDDICRFYVRKFPDSPPPSVPGA